MEEAEGTGKWKIIGTAELQEEVQVLLLALLLSKSQAHNIV